MKGSQFKDYILKKLFTLSQKALAQFPETDMMIWPETAVPLSFRIRKGEISRPYSLHKRFLSYVKSQSIPLITGTYLRDEKDQTYNSLLLLDGEGNLMDNYSKSHLLLFGETFWGLERLLPLGKWIPGLGEGFAKGQGPKVSTFKEWQIGWHICYDSLYPSFSRELAQKGAQFIVNLTNDSWFGNTSEPYQHRTIALARGIEVRRSIVRSTNSGFSMVMSFTGEIFNPSPLGKEWYGMYDVPILTKGEQTFYTRFGFIWLYMKLLALFLILSFSLKLFHKSKGRSH